jgi:uncharacterized protein (TIGR02466 family)
VYYENFLPQELAQNIKEYVLKKAGEATSHKAISGSGLSSHRKKYVDFIGEVTSSVKGCSQLYNNIVACIDDYTVKTGIPKNKIINSWFNIQQPGSILKRHHHIGGYSLVAGALFINVDEKSSSIVFDNPNPYSFMFDYNNEDKCSYTYMTRSFQPGIGDLILFPTWLIHASGNANNTKDRIVISFNTIQSEPY